MEQKLPFYEQIHAISGLESIAMENKVHGYLDKYSVINELAWICKFAFDFDYNQYRNKEDNRRKHSGDNSFFLKQYTSEFQDKTGYDRFIKEYPILQRLSSEYLSSKYNYLNEILSNFKRDKQALSEIFNNNIRLSEILKIETGKGDNHQHGKSTTIVYFKCGKKIVYKPRHGGMDSSFNTLLEKLNNENIGVVFKTLKSIDKESYSWIEYVDHLPVNNIGEIHKYYKRCGALLALVYCLKGFDLHFENVISCGEYPIIIDMECLLDNSYPNYNVLSTGLVPQYFFLDIDKKELPHDISGFGSDNVGETPAKFWQWDNINSDNLKLVRGKVTINKQKNLPIFNGKSVSPKAYLNETIEGFRLVCNWIIGYNNSLKNDNHVFSLFRNKPIRVLPRTTQEYKNLLENSYIPKALKSFDDRDIIIDKFLREFPLTLPIKDEHKELIYYSERLAIKRMDIPYFMANSSEYYLKESNDIVIENFYNITPYDNIIKRLKELDETDIQEQVNIITNAFIARYNIDYTTSCTAITKSQIPLAIELDSIVNTILKHSTNIEGIYSWNCYTPHVDGKFVFDILDDSLYSGKLGISLFLTAYAKHTQNNEVNIIAYSIVDEFILNVNDYLNKVGNKNLLSYSSGLAGVIYALIKINAKKYQKIALQLASLISFDIILKDDHIDIMNGIAGALVVFTELYKLTNSKEILDKSMFMASSLLSKRIVDNKSGLKIWQTPLEGKPLTGFAHGASGIAYSLLRAFEIIGDNELKAAFYEAIDFEDLYFDKQKNNWRDLRDRREQFHNAWCFGATGIGLSRLYAYKLFDDQRFLKDINLVIEKIKVSPLNDLDFYCCGSIGQIDFLIEASNVLNDKSILNLAKSKLVDLKNKKMSLGHYTTYELLTISQENPSLFRGLSGIGYLSLRLLNPQLPCIGLIK
ncbi:MAG: type 2 lantipeptide synthetase LanM [Flavobacteriaceae bacterium]|jgi:type 2 lantibiotic biosynthesis protein LanM|nr:type 2 lantipeptide synthetase LanM [Flavobacteriaceae bacterium]